MRLTALLVIRSSDWFGNDLLFRWRRSSSGVIQRHDQDRLDDSPRIVLRHDDHSTWSHGYEIRMWNGQAPSICQTDRKWLEWLLVQCLSNTSDVHSRMLIPDPEAFKPEPNYC